MIIKLARGLAALSLALTSLAASGAAHAAAAEPVVLPLTDAVAALPLAVEARDGYSRDAFRHWNAGANPTDGCSTRGEVLIAEAVTAPAVGARCALTGGTWFSYYDEATVTTASGLDIDHMVPLAEAWDSGAFAWTAERREAYANDLGQDSSLVAVTARSNRSKSDQDPAQWLPPATSALCRYVSEWTATKLRWDLATDQSEHDRLTELAAGCGDTTVIYEPAS
ncbi:HNH endonuclease family protein [Streptomyces hirsutus]|uniref:HNH endonuclease family protein n=1 Tax=Streptomyces hirsutus TaxID=35620 RepID=UPI0006E1F747|nr:HNH endonuclease family protein [Streptomyces hirsutus]